MELKYFQLSTLLTLLVLLVAVGMLSFMLSQNPSGKQISHEYLDVRIGSTTVRAEVAATAAKRGQGLSGHTPLGEREGMLFVFDAEGEWGFWMKDMSFSIDIIWINEEKEVVTIAAEAAPDSYPAVFYPSRPAKYVLEVPAGFAAAHGIAEGTKIVLE